MLKAAVTGITGSGKTAIASSLQKRGWPVVSADRLARQASSPPAKGHKQLVRLLGREYFHLNGSLNRKKTAALVFKTPALLKKIESIIHPEVWALVKKKSKELEQSGAAAAFFEIPLLFENNLESFFDVTLVSAISPRRQKALALKNQGLSWGELSARLRFHLPQEEKIKRANYVIWNNSSLKALEKEVELWLKKLKLPPTRDKLPC